MSELHDRYDRGAVGDRIIQPPFAELTGRARRRAHRNRTARLAGVAVLAALVAVPLLTMQGDRGEEPLAPEFPEDFYGDGRSESSWSFSMEFYDPRHSYATYTGSSCETAWLSATRDGGASWSELREMPGTWRVPAPGGARSEWGCSHPWVIPISTETLTVLVGTSTLAGYEWVDPYTTAYISRDAGESWREYAPQVRTVDTVPGGTAPGRHCEDDLCEQMRLGWYDALTGDRMVLRNNPPDLVGRAGPVLADDGSIWVTGVDEDGYYRVWVSEDRGRSWQERSPDPVGDPTDPGDAAEPKRGTEFATADGETAYLWAWGPGPDDALYRTTDGGDTWQPLPAGQPATEVADLRVASDGTLAVVDDSTGTQHLSEDGGESFRADLAMWDVTPIVGGWYGWAADDSASDPIDGYVSEDGLTWLPIRAPRP
jgi:hypothetical protein